MSERVGLKAEVVCCNVCVKAEVVYRNACIDLELVNVLFIIVD